MNKRNWLLALSLSLAFSPCYADWAKLKAAASDLGTAVSETGKEVWQDVSDFSLSWLGKPLPPEAVLRPAPTRRQWLLAS